MGVFLSGKNFIARSRLASFGVLAAASLVAGGALAQLKPPEGVARVTIKVASSSEESFEGKLAYQVARANGYFDEQGIDIEDITVGGGGAAGLQPLVAGQVQVAFLSLSTTLQAIAQGRDIRLGASNQVVNTWLPIISVAFLKDKNIEPEAFSALSTQERWNAIKGSTWAVSSPGGLYARAVSHLGRHYGLNPETELAIVAVPGTATQIATLKSRRVDAFLAGSPENVNLVEDGTAVHVLSREELVNEVPLVAYTRNAEVIIHNEWFRANEDVGRRFFTAYQKGADYISAHSPKDVAEVLVKIFPDYSVERATQLVDLEWANTPKDSKATPESIQAQIDFALATGAITKPIPLEETYNFDFIPAPNLSQEW